MTALLSLAWRSLLNRKGSVILTIVAVALSVALFLGVEKARSGAREGFGNTISGTDLIVGAPTGSVNLLLYSVFRMGSATAEVSWPTYEKLAARPDIAWTVPVALGDSHRGYRVMGTTLGRAFCKGGARHPGSGGILPHGRGCGLPAESPGRQRAGL